MPAKESENAPTKAEVKIRIDETIVKFSGEKFLLTYTLLSGAMPSGMICVSEQKGDKWEISGAYIWNSNIRDLFIRAIPLGLSRELEPGEVLKRVEEEKVQTPSRKRRRKT